MTAVEDVDVRDDVFEPAASDARWWADQSPADEDPEPVAVASEASAAPFTGLSHAEVLELDFGDEPAELVEGLIPRGVLVVVAGLPETFKGWVCAKAAAIVAAGEGELFGRPACSTGPVGYFWQDDSTRNEADRVRLFSQAHETPGDLAVRWFLNEGAILPDDLERLRATVEHFGFVMVVLDSVYNFTPTLDLKDRDVGQLFARIKAEICDPTGCTVLVVDHMPWATDTNRQRLRAYGDVFKGAAARAGIYIDAEKSKLYVEARGNTIAGFKRTPAYWDADALELRLVDTSRQDEADDDLDERVLEWLVEHPGQHSTTALRRAITGRNERVDSALERLKGRGELSDLARNGGAWSGRGGEPRYWIASVHAEINPPDLFGAGSGEVASGASEEVNLAPPPHPRRGARFIGARFKTGGRSPPPQPPTPTPRGRCAHEKAPREQPDHARPRGALNPGGGGRDRRVPRQLRALRPRRASRPARRSPAPRASEGA